MNAEEQKLGETKEPKKQRDPKSSPVKNAEVREILVQVLDSNKNLKGIQDNLTNALLEAMDKIDMMSVASEILANKIDEIQTGVAACHEEITRDGPESENDGDSQQIVDPDAMKGFVTTREIFDKYSKQFSRRDGELANKKFLNLLEKLCLMHDDYAKLCSDIGKNVKSFTGEEVLKSFEAYLVDLENMLGDAGVTIGRFGSDGDQVDVLHQRIVGVVPTSDAAKNGTIAKRVSDGYEYDGRAIIKEKVQAYKINEQPEPAKTQTGFRLSPTQ